MPFTSPNPLKVFNSKSGAKPSKRRTIWRVYIDDGDIPIFLRKCQPEIRISAISPIAIKLTNNRTSTDAGDTAARCVSQHMAAHLHTVYIEILISVGKVEIRVLFKIGGHLNDTCR